MLKTCELAGGPDRLNCRVFYHDKCFDGACSASVFTRFHRECIGTADDFEYQGLVHRAGSLYDESWFEQAARMRLWTSSIRASPRVTWWFDHHLSAFLTPEDEAHFLAWQKNA